MSNATGTNLGDEPAVAGSAGDLLEGLLDRAADQLTQAACELDYSNKQEAQAARGYVATARVLVEDARSALREGQRGSKAPHGKAPKAG